MMNQYVKNLGKVRPTTEGNHNINKEYDILSIVTAGSSSYISRKFVPIGTPINNEEYWQLLAKGGTSNNDDPDIDNEQLEQIINDISNQSIALTRHIEDNNVHVTSEEKNNWNQGIVSNEERNKWNQNVITNEERETWNNGIVSDEERETWNQGVVSNEERETWNNGIITEEERQRWNQGVGGELYIADEEDITLTQNADSTGRVYQFKNRDTSKGMGYIILRTDKTLAEQITEENTIYEIRYDFDLDGETLEIPNNCVLKFEGGKLFNGSIKGNSTSIEASICKIFDINTVIEGVWDVQEGHPEWFGAKGDGTNDDTLAIQCCLNYFVTTRLLDKTYLLKTITNEEYQSCLTLAKGKNIIGECTESMLTDENGTLKVDSSITPKVILYIDGKNKISSINIIGNSSRDSVIQQTGIKTKTNAYVSIENVGVSGTYYGFNMCVFMSTLKKCISAYNYIGFYVRGITSSDTLQAENTSIFMENCYAVDSFMQGFYLRGLIYSVLVSCGADGCGWQGYETPITSSRRVESYWIRECKGLTLIGCGMEQATKAVKWSSCLDCSWRDSVFILKNSNLDDNYSFDKTFHFGYCQNIIFENIRVKHDGIGFTSENKLFYFESATTGLLYAKIVNLQNLYDGNLYDIIDIQGMSSPKYDCVDIRQANFRRKIGASDLRPTLSSYDKNERYWDETLATSLVWDGSLWRNGDGTLETKVKFI